MCGICGIITEDIAAAEPAVRRMMRAMVHRGPDDEGYAQFRLAGEGGPIAAFGFRRLSILDLSSAGHQPMVNRDTGDCLVFNGEIYNYRDIRERLASRGIAVESTGDTEVLLKALSTWGEAALDDIDGMFAFAFYEAKTRRILLARDHMGIKPLYVARGPWGLVFASEVRALLASGVVPADIDEAGLATFLAYGAPQDPLTMHRFVKSFPSASCQWVGEEVARNSPSASPRRYWRFPEVHDPGPAEQMIMGIRSLLQNAVAQQSISDVPLAVFLSAGIDSATIAAIAREQLKEVCTFSVGNDVSSECDESKQATETAVLLGTKHVQTILDDERVFAEWREWLLLSDRPSVDGLNMHIVCSAVKGFGNTVALSGLGADELFGGYHTFDHVRRLRKMLWPFDAVPGAVRKRLPALAIGIPATKRRRAAELLPDPSFLGLTLGMRRVFMDDELQSLGLDTDRLGLTSHWLPPDAYEPLGTSGKDLFRTVSLADTFLYMGNTLLRDADTNSMANSVEVRVPFLSRKVVDLVGSIPGKMHLPVGPARKHLLRKAMAATVPAAVFERPKRGFLLPLSRWMNGPLKHDCETRVRNVWERAVVRPDAARRIWGSLTSIGSHAVERKRLAMVALGTYLGKPQPCGREINLPLP
jgi:asparagine synthase (glutamine-hydrolysing)